jgi:hypothetical protein
MTQALSCIGICHSPEPSMAGSLNISTIYWRFLHLECRNRKATFDIQYRKPQLARSLWHLKYSSLVKWADPNSWQIDSLSENKKYWRTSNAWTYWRSKIHTYCSFFHWDFSPGESTRNWLWIRLKIWLLKILSYSTNRHHLCNPLVSKIFWHWLFFL